MNPIVTMIIVTVLSASITEIASNVATANVVLPVLCQLVIIDAFLDHCSNIDCDWNAGSAHARQPTALPHSCDHQYFVCFHVPCGNGMLSRSNRRTDSIHSLSAATQCNSVRTFEDQHHGHGEFFIVYNVFYACPCSLIYWPDQAWIDAQHSCHYGSTCVHQHAWNGHFRFARVPKLGQHQFNNRFVTSHSHRWQHCLELERELNVHERWFLLLCNITFKVHSR